jgi:uncharacterized protein
MAHARLVGSVTKVQRYPVKSMGVDPLQVGDLRWNGLNGDRQYAFVKAKNQSSFPYLTARDVPNLLLYKAIYLNPDDPRGTGVKVLSPSGVNYDIEDPLLCMELADTAGEALQLMQLGRGHFDSAPVSIITTTNAARLEEKHGSDVALQRFRINIIVDPVDSEAWDRDWLSLPIKFGDASSPASLRVDFPIQRCAMITLDPDTAERDVSIMRTVAKHFDNEIGMYCSVQSVGMIRTGDPVYL